VGGGRDPPPKKKSGLATPEKQDHRLSQRYLGSPMSPVAKKLFAGKKEIRLRKKELLLIEGGSSRRGPGTDYRHFKSPAYYEEKREARQREEKKGPTHRKKRGKEEKTTQNKPQMREEEYPLPIEEGSTPKGDPRGRVPSGEAVEPGGEL